MRDPKRYLWLLVPSAPGAVTLSWLLVWTTRLHFFWWSNTVIMNVFLLHLRRHSDHHIDPSHRYQGIRHATEAPQLPSNYTAMLVLSLVPTVGVEEIEPLLPRRGHRQTGELL